MGGRVTAQTTVRERDRPYGGDAMRATGPVGGRGCDDDDCDERAGQDEPKQPRHPSPGHATDPFVAAARTVAITPAPR